MRLAPAFPWARRIDRLQAQPPVVGSIVALPSNVVVNARKTRLRVSDVARPRAPRRDAVGVRCIMSAASEDAVDVCHAYYITRTSRASQRRNAEPTSWCRGDRYPRPFARGARSMRQPARVCPRPPLVKPTNRHRRKAFECHTKQDGPGGSRAGRRDAIWCRSSCVDAHRVGQMTRPTVRLYASADRRYSVKAGSDASRGMRIDRGVALVVGDRVPELQRGATPPRCPCGFCTPNTPPSQGHIVEGHTSVGPGGDHQRSDCPRDSRRPR